MMGQYRQRYRSGHNGADSKSVWEQSHEGSNPSRCATSPRTSYRSRRLFIKITSHSFCRGSFPNRNYCVGLRFGFWARTWKPVLLNRAGISRRSKLHIACSDFFQKSERAHCAAPPFQIEPVRVYAGLTVSACIRPEKDKITFRAEPGKENPRICALP